MDTRTMWRRSKYCANGACVELHLSPGAVRIRDGKLGDRSPVLNLDTDQFRGLVAAARRGDLDRPS